MITNNAIIEKINKDLADLSLYIDEHIFCDLVGVRSEKCDKLLNLKATAMNLLTECEAYCGKAYRIATNTE